MSDIIYALKPVVPYILFFLALFFVLFFLIFFFEKRGIDDYSAGYFGFFMNISKRKVLALSILIIYYFFMLESIFLNTNFSIINLIIMLILAIATNLLATDFKYLFISIIFSVGMYFGMYFQKMFINYLKDIDHLWYLQVCAILLGLFMVFIATFYFIRNASSISLKKKIA